MTMRERYFLKQPTKGAQFKEIGPLRFNTLYTMSNALLEGAAMMRIGYGEFALEGQVLFEYAPDAVTGDMPRVWHLIVNGVMICSAVNTWNYEGALIEDIRQRINWLQADHPNLKVVGFDV